jgi:hypothetical protein
MPGGNQFPRHDPQRIAVPPGAAAGVRGLEEMDSLPALAGKKAKLGMHLTQVADICGSYVGRAPSPAAGPLAGLQQADGGVRRGPGGPPHEAHAPELSTYPAKRIQRVRGLSVSYVWRGTTKDRGKMEATMNQYAFSLSAGVIFLLIALGHVLRVVFGVSFVVDGISVPMWPSLIAVVITGFLAYEGFHFARKSPPKV